MFLAFDTTLDICSVALLDDAGEVAAHTAEPMSRGHAEALVPMIAATLEAAGRSMDEVRRVAVTVGPGTFTGVRVGISAARGLTLALKIPVAGIGTLEMLAGGAAFSGEIPAGAKVLAAIDARRGQAYMALYQLDGEGGSYPLHAEAEPAAVALEEAGAWLAEHAGPADAPSNTIVAVGSAAGLIGGLEGRSLNILPAVGPDAVTVARLGEKLPSERWDKAPQALYLRPPDAKLPTNALRREAL